ncbi:DNA polymerase I [Pseudoglutamicibacter albus]|uniref:DNA polymerase I n=1 Tax=Pseudoglutamicibacter albus TaxID=98671 RepID=UPI000C7920C5|nr:DNA polymerase I [Pseudoglutamicibacter albus]
MGIRLSYVSVNAKSSSSASSSSSESKPRLLVIDGHSMAFRAFFALPAENFSTATGQYTNAVHGFVSMLLKMIEQREPTHVAVAFDLSGPTIRSQQYEEYKGGRAETPPEFAGQIELIDQVMAAMNIPTLTYEGYEADDILATLSTRGAADGFEVLVVSGDRDTFQLINDDVLVLYPMRGISDIPPMDAAAVEERYGVLPQNYPDMAALVGEKADNLPGVPGVGNKTAAKWINLYGSVEDILAHANEIKGKVGQNLRDHVDDVRRNRELNALVRDLDVDVTWDDMRVREPEWDRIEDLFDSLEFNTLRRRLNDVMGGLSEDEGPAVELPNAVSATSAKDIREWLDGVAAPDAVAGSVAALRAELAAEHAVGEASDVLSISVAVLPEDSAQAEVLQVDLAQLDEEATDVVAGWLADAERPKVVYDLKPMLKALWARGLKVAGVIDDVALSAYLVQPDRRGYALEDLAQQHLKRTLGEAAAQEAGQLDLGLDEDGSAVDGREAERADVTLRLHTVLQPMLVDREAEDLLTQVEVPLASVLADMEATGVAVDLDALDDLIDSFTQNMNRAQQQAFDAIGHEVNLSSPKQLQTVLFEELELPKTKKIKTGYTTDAASLQDLLVKTGHPFLEALMAHRDVSKLRQTVEGLKKTVAVDGRIHTTFSQTAAATGRLSSLNPNLQNIPVRTEEGRRIRDIFTCGDSAELLTADYSQIEMRIMAHLSGDEALIQAFKDGEDLHRFVGSRVFDVAPEDVSPEMRSKVKAMSYGLAYGLSQFGLSQQLGISVDEARTLRNDYFKRFGAVRDYLDEVVDQARVDGYTSTLLGRRRYLPELHSDNRQLREMAKRAALNAPIQGTAADIIKLAMLRIPAAFEDAGLESKMLLQVHDELIFEVVDGEQDKVRSLVVEIMSGAMELSVPLDVNIGTGRTWHDAAH